VKDEEQICKEQSVNKLIDLGSVVIVIIVVVSVCHSFYQICLT
jgi:hypothetical protein